MTMKTMTHALFAACLIVASLWAAASFAAEEDFYSGKTIIVYVGRPPGSGADLAVRSFVRFWQRQIPGEPTMVVKNVPGGGGSRVWNLGWDSRNADGLEIYFSPVSGVAEIVHQEGLRADLSQMPLVGARMSPNLTFARTEHLKRAEDLPNVKGLKFGGQAPAHRFSILGRLTLDILGVEYRNVTGFQGASDVFNALRRREVDIQTAPLNFYRFTVEPTLVEGGKAIPLWYNPVINEDGEIVPLPAAGNIPSFIDYYKSVKGKPPEGELFDIYKWLLPNINGIVYAAVLPPDSPAASAEILRESFLEVTKDPEYQAEELKMFGFNLPVVTAKQGARMIDNMTHAPEHVRSFLEQYIRQGG